MVPRWSALQPTKEAGPSFKLLWLPGQGATGFGSRVTRRRHTAHGIAHGEAVCCRTPGRLRRPRRRGTHNPFKVGTVTFDDDLIVNVQYDVVDLT